ncbi:LPXTG cell wall anchor domain-containing protein [Enterococcus sp. AZ072]|uniref:LPXTG cell wall anchor domain-containing protein n=1 Tax=unclassified Enterococcus TaxID=2608891 RepID=UPI003D2B3557
MKKWLLLGACVLAFPMTVNAESTEVNGNGAVLAAQEETVISTEDSSQTTTSTELTNDSKNTGTSGSATEQEPIVPATEEQNQSSVEKVSGKKAEDIQKEVIKGIEKDSGIKATKEQSANISAQQWREALYEIGGNLLSKEEIDGYTDQQLLDAQTLFERYNYDTVGMDASSFARLLRALYQDKTISYDEAAKALAFNPNNYKSSLDMISDIDQLQAYLKVMYPANSSFWGIRDLTNDELIAILKQIAPFQQKIIEEQGSLWPGVIALISNYAEKGLPATSTDQSDHTSTSTSESAGNTVNNGATTPSSSETQTVIQKLLPKTGEQKTTWMIVIGLVIIGAVAYIWLRKIRPRH